MLHEAHPAAKVMPALSDTEYQALVDSIKSDGLIYTIKLLDDQVIDGVHREKACFDAGVEPRYEQIETDDPVRYVLGCDKRRHLTTRQRAAIAAELANMKREDTLKQNQTEGPNGPSVTIDEAADLMGVGVRSVKRAKKVMREQPEIHERIKRGEKVTVKAQQKQKPKRVFWTNIALEYGLFTATGGWSRIEAKKDLAALASGLDLDNLTEDDEPRFRQACEELQRRRQPEQVKVEQEQVIDEINPILSMSAQQRVDAAIRAHKKLLEAEAEIELQRRLNEEVLPKYNELHDKHIEIINAWQGVLTHDEYRLILGVLHSDRLPMLDDIHKAKFDRAFDILKKKEMLLCGLKASQRATNTLPKSVVDLLKRRGK